MGSPIGVHLFVEDHAQEAFLSALLQRVTGEQQFLLDLQIFSARGGRPRVLQELAVYQKSILTVGPWQSRTDLLVVGIDANCKIKCEAGNTHLQGHRYVRYAGYKSHL